MIEEDFRLNNVMKSFDNVFNTAMLQMNEDDTSASSPDNVHLPIQNFLQLSPDDQKRIADVYNTFAKNSQTNPQINSQTISTMSQSPDVKAAFDAYQAGKSSKPSTSTTTTPSQAQAQVPDSTGSNPTGASPSSPAAGQNPIIP